MTSSNAKTIQKSFTGQAKNFETKSMNFTKREYLEHAEEKHIIKKEKAHGIWPFEPYPCAF